MVYLVKIDDDFILSDDHGYSLKCLLQDNPNGIPNGVAQELLGLPQEVYNEALRTAERTIRQHLEP